MRGRNAKRRSFASLTLPETGRATGQRLALGALLVRQVDVKGIEGL